MGRQYRKVFGTTTDQLAGDETLKRSASPDACKFLRKSNDSSDYNV
jgi:hypothetical protein